MRENFHAELQNLDLQLASMCQRAGTAMRDATEALLRVDLGKAEGVIGGDEALDDARTELEARAYALLALQAPVATDLRVVLASIRVAERLERMGDLARHIAQAARRRHPNPAVPEPLRATFADMGAIAAEMADIAEGVIRRHTSGPSLHELEDRMDALHRSVFAATMGDDWSYGVMPAVDATLLARFYERYADHAMSIARRVAFVPPGTAWASTE
ncbi:phosphate signaling complex protein PhoU [Kutzneria sp. NPDC051319]|uniref:phosphate signaling complex protein PhoU n=1 Tax=Kutzneria sp. NPDC051319 TaxID=3155047 RepID=UPI003415E3CD